MFQCSFVILILALTLLFAESRGNPLQSSENDIKLRCAPGQYVSGFYGSEDASSIGLTCRSHNSNVIVNSKTLGSDQGTPVIRSPCSNDAVAMKGIVVYVSNSTKVVAVRGVCSDGSWSLFSRLRLEYLHDEGVIPQVFHCPAATVVTGLIFDFNNHDLKEFKNIQASCGYRNTPYDVNDDGSVAISVLEISGTKQSLRCPPGYLVTGLIAKSTFYALQGLGIKCASVSNGTRSVVNLVGNPVGNLVEKDCTNGYFLDGIEGSTGSTVNGIKGTCFDGAHTSIIGESRGLAFRVTCPSDQGVIGFSFSLDSSTGMNGLEALCGEASSLRYVAGVESAESAESVAVAAPSQQPTVQEKQSMPEKLAKAREAVMKEGYVGVIRFDEPSGDEGNLCVLEPPVSLTFDDISTNNQLSSADTPTAIVAHTKADVRVLCGQHSSPTADGCMWNSTDFLGLLYEQGVFLFQNGASQRTAFSMYVHGVQLASNRVACSPGSTAKMFSVPPNYESLYGIMSARIVSAIKQSGAGLPEPQKVKPSKISKLENLKKRAMSWDITQEIPADLFPTKDFLLRPSNTDLSGITIKISDADMAEDAEQSMRFLRDETDQGLSLQEYLYHGKGFNEESKQSLSEHNENLPGVYRAGVTYMPFLCGPYEKYFPFQYIGTRGRPLVHYYQHCCAKTCLYYKQLTRVPNIGSALYQCCRTCNKYECDPTGSLFISTTQKRSAEDLLAKASVIRSLVKESNESRPPVYSLQV